MKVLFAVSECVPFIKSGGLADVAGSLPKELKKLGTDVRVILPKYGTIPERYLSQLTKVKDFTVSVGWRNQYCGIEELTCQGVTFYFVDNEYYFKRDNLYGYFDDGERFAFFNRAVLEALSHIGFYPDVVHCHDWHTAMIPYFLRTEYYKRKDYAQIRSVFTIHNLQFQGVFSKDILEDLLGLGEQDFHPDRLEFHGAVSFMKGALAAADKITTVSPTYLDEIKTPHYGERLDGMLRARQEDMHGLINGIDEEFYNPADDSFLSANYTADDHRKKSVSKQEIQRLFELPENPDVPMITMITRLTKQKGLDLVKCVLHELLQENVQFVVLGTGDKEYEDYLKHMEYEHPEKFKVHIGFDEGLAHKLYAGGDLFLMPSLFEPCGLGQIIAMKYGAVPIVRETGGLNDTVQAWNELSRKGNGFTFQNFNAHDMLYTIKRALHFYNDESMWPDIVSSAMKMDYSWAKSAHKYNCLYKELVTGSETHVF